MSDDALEGDFDFQDAMNLGTGYALYRHGQDRLAAQIRAALHDALEDFRPSSAADAHHEARPETHPRLVDLSFPGGVDEVIGHEGAVQQLQLHIESVRIRRGRLPHLLLTSTMSGVGRRALVRWAAGRLGKKLVELVPPFSAATLLQAVELLGDYDILYVDDLDLACRQGSPGPQALLAVLDRELVDANGESRWVPEITIAGATTEPAAVAAGLRDRFVVRLDLPDPTWPEVSRRVIEAAYQYRALDEVDSNVAVTIARLCMDDLAAIDGMVLLARDLGLSLGRPPLPDEVEALARPAHFNEG